MQHRATHVTERKEKKSHKKLLILLLLFLFLFVALAATAVVYYLWQNETQEEPPQIDQSTGPGFAPNASVGALPGKTEEEIEAMLTQKINEKMVAFTVNAEPYFEDGTSMGNLMLESPANNINNIEFVIRRDDTDEVIYRSGLLQPNQYIAEDTLDVDLDAGVYNCTVDITLYDPETNEAKGMSQAGITITIKN